ncbi:hypothetical protein [Paracoccus sp. DMF]|uniref:hypothetical protein n=1 Tax=Paracoccus sp. DMF TaxID=400837 RepID=UPI0021E4D9C2|nr:hypothetical protein [Paracoccus sp. DMF]MDQ7777408.1 hypothetical protein [Paracoccus aminovorans]
MRTPGKHHPADRPCISPSATEGTAVIQSPGNGIEQSGGAPVFSTSGAVVPFSSARPDRMIIAPIAAMNRLR